MFYEWLRERQLVHPDSDHLTPTRALINPRTRIRRNAASEALVQRRLDSLHRHRIGQPLRRSLSAGPASRHHEHPSPIHEE